MIFLTLLLVLFISLSSASSASLSDLDDSDHINHANDSKDLKSNELSSNISAKSATLSAATKVKSNATKLTNASKATNNKKAANKTVNKKVSALLNLPGHMAQIWLGCLDRPLANASKQDLQEIVKQLTRFQFIPTGTSGYTKAEVTAGGIDTQEINPSTFEVKKVPDLYIIGELLDVTGELGGFNLHWAWASGYCAGQDLAKKI